NEEHLPIAAFKEYFVEPAIEMFVQIGTLNGTMAGLVQPGGFAAGYTADEAFVANLLGVFKLTDEMASLNGWTATRTLQLAKTNKATEDGMREANQSSDVAPTTIEEVYAKLAENPLSEADLEKDIESRKITNMDAMMNPFTNITRYGIDSLNSKLGSHLISEESPLRVGSEYLLSSFGAGSILKNIGLNERYLAKVMLGVKVDLETGEKILEDAKYSYVAMKGREHYAGEGGEDVKLGRLLGYGRGGDFYFAGDGGETRRFDISGLTEKEKKGLGFDLKKAAYVYEEDGKTVVMNIGEDGLSAKDGLINNKGTLVFGFDPDDLEAEGDGGETTVNFGTFTVGEGDQQQKVEFSAAFDQEVTEKGTTLDTVVLTQTKKKTVPNVAKGREALEEALKKDPSLSHEEQRAIYLNAAQSSVHSVGVRLGGWSKSGEAAVAAAKKEWNNKANEAVEAFKKTNDGEISEEKEEEIRKGYTIYTPHKETLAGLTGRAKREAMQDIYLEIYNAGAADDEEFFEAGRREDGTVVFQKGRRTYDAFHVAQNLDGVSGG
ncbi:MAG: hypothetical protein KAR31_01935, partial [Candidatus Omnitrophica bacterium]|nr:hypothetical protein [Candidatus Omnitrophota bacterium]